MAISFNTESIINAFEESVSRFPDKIALKFEGQTLSYKELNKKVDNFFAKIAKHQIRQEEIVTIILPPSIEMVVSILAILKAGCAYLPIDIEAPLNRALFQIQDSNSRIIITNKGITIPTEVMIRINVDEGPGVHDEVYEYPTIKGTNLAYVIYTSGTTGNPKGVMIEHRNVMSLFNAVQNLFDFSQNDVWCLFHSYSFDFSVWEILGAMLTGGKLIIIPRNLARDSESFTKFIREERITVLNQTPSAFRNIRLECVNESEGNNIRYIIFGGEKLNPSIIKNWKIKFPDIKYINMYGITETTVHVTYREITDNEISSEISNIGTALPNAAIYIYNDGIKNITPGLEGELCVGGGGVGRGYLNRKNLTNEKFINYKNGKIYRSGDIVKVIDVNNIQYIGRNDNQVKIRGFRIELEEIEKRILEINDISNAIVIDKSDANGNSYLCAYYISKNEYEPKEFKTILSRDLPSYMIPAFYVKINEVPLTINGKLDKSKLPIPYITNNSASTINNIYEYKLSEIWKNVLGNNIHFDQETNFFEVGGNSLLASQLIYEINKQLNISYSLKEFYASPFIKKMCSVIEEEKISIPSITTDILDFYPLTMVQLDIVNDIEHVNTLAYNVTKAYKITGYIDEKKLINIFLNLVKKYKILRVSICDIDGIPYQVVNEFPDFNMQCIQIKKSDQYSLFKYIEPYCLKNSQPLVRFKLLCISDDERILLLDAHHVIVDEVSIGLIVKEAFDIYYDKSLFAEKISYLDYAVWQSTNLKSEYLKKQERFWFEKLSKFKLNLLPFDQKEEGLENEYFDEVIILPPQTVEEIRLFANYTNTSVFAVLLAAIKVAIVKETNENDLTVEIISANRENPYIGDLIGCVINSLFIRSKIDTQKSFKENLNEVSLSYFEARDNSDYPFELVEKYVKDMLEHPRKFIATKVNYIPYNSAFIDPKGQILIEPIIQKKKSSRHNFSVLIQEMKDCTEINLLFNRRVHNSSQIKRLAKNINNVFEEISIEINSMVKTVL